MVPWTCKGVSLFGWVLQPPDIETCGRWLISNQCVILKSFPMAESPKSCWSMSRFVIAQKDPGDSTGGLSIAQNILQLDFQLEFCECWRFIRGKLRLLEIWISGAHVNIQYILNTCLHKYWSVSICSMVSGSSLCFYSSSAADYGLIIAKIDYWNR